jgi:hypothetical protein
MQSNNSMEAAEAADLLQQALVEARGLCEGMWLMHSATGIADIVPEMLERVTLDGWHRFLENTFGELITNAGERWTDASSSSLPTMPPELRRSVHCNAEQFYNHEKFRGDHQTWSKPFKMLEGLDEHGASNMACSRRAARQRLSRA